MNPQIIKIGPAEYRTSSWSGGTTTQLIIFPPEAEYAKRDFLWRISSATVDLEASDFTPLPDYDRLICTLRGEISLSHNGNAPFLLRPCQVYAFSGADQTRSEGRCTDFNLMLRRGKAAGEMFVLHIGAVQTVMTEKAAEQILVYCAEGKCKLHAGAYSGTLSAGESLLISDCSRFQPAFTLNADNETVPATIIICRMWRI